jgi:ubiquitin-conjugating enzyme E2 G1
MSNHARSLVRSRCAPAISRARSELNKSPVEGFSAGLVDESNPFEWEICIMGPPDTP